MNNELKTLVQLLVSDFHFNESEAIEVARQLLAD